MAETSDRKFNSICVFGGSTPGIKIEFSHAAKHLGSVLAKKKIRLVYGGGCFGLMGCVSAAAYVGGSQVLGITPRPLTVGNLVGYTIGEELKVSSMHERMSKMIANSDAFIALPGGFGTLEEIFQILSWTQLNIHQKPIGLLNVDGFYDGLLAFLDHVVEQKFLTQAARKILISASTADELIDQLQAFVPVIDPIISQIDWSNKDNSRKRKPDLTLRL